MQPDKLLLKNLAFAANLANTINGGMSKPLVKMSRYDDEWIVKAKVPGVNVDNLRLEVRDHHLFIYQVMKVADLGLGEIPFLLTMLHLSENIDYDAIIAEYHDTELYITLPFNEKAGGYERVIQIRKR